MFVGQGKIEYHNDPLKIIVSVDQEMVNYYRQLIPKYKRVYKQRYPGHISVVRNERPENYRVWYKHSSRLIEFQYNNVIYNDEVYYWLEVVCPQLEDIRAELGLPNTSQWTKSPTGGHSFHITLGNVKHENF